MEIVVEIIKWLGMLIVLGSPIVFGMIIFRMWKLFTAEDFVISIIMFSFYTLMIAAVVLSPILDTANLIIGIAAISVGVIELIKHFIKKK